MEESICPRHKAEVEAEEPEVAEDLAEPKAEPQAEPQAEKGVQIEREDDSH